MEEDNSISGWLSRKFKSVIKHAFSPTMIFMMAAMAFPAVSAAAAAAGTGATFGDIGLSTVDMFWEMAKAPFTDGGVVVDAFTNLMDGNIMPGSYEFGSMDHGAMMEHMAQAQQQAAAEPFKFAPEALEYSGD